MKVPGLAPHFQIELTREGRMDAMTVLTEAAETATGAEARQANAADLSARIKDVVGVSTKVQVADPGGVTRSQGKAVRVVDRRSE